MKMILTLVLVSLVSLSVRAEQLNGQSVTHSLSRPFTQAELKQEQDLAIENALRYSKGVIYWLRTNTDAGISRELRRFLPLMGELHGVERRIDLCESGEGRCMYTEVELSVNHDAMQLALELLQKQAKLDDYLDYFINNSTHAANTNGINGLNSADGQSEYRQILALFLLKEIEWFYGETLIYVESKTATRTTDTDVNYQFTVNGYFVSSERLERSILRVFELVGIQLRRVERLVRQGTVGDSPTNAVMRFDRGNQLNVSQVCFSPIEDIPEELVKIFAGDSVLSLPLPSKTEYVRIGDNQTSRRALLLSDSNQLCFWRSFGLEYHVTLDDKEVNSYSSLSGHEFLPKLTYTLDVDSRFKTIDVGVPASNAKKLRLPAPPAMDPAVSDLFDSELLIGCHAGSAFCIFNN
ncbi:hypothetical protein ACRZ5S_22995 (plasmid) [Vibrio scophthalmi]|uniref:hypothetical protein n=1 Tax=Vibrio scophthalmi TaxID=45658 RepID=UPI003EBE93EB